LCLINKCYSSAWTRTRRIKRCSRRSPAHVRRTLRYPNPWRRSWKLSTGLRWVDHPSHHTNYTHTHKSTRKPFGNRKLGGPVDVPSHRSVFKTYFLNFPLFPLFTYSSLTFRQDDVTSDLGSWLLLFPDPRTVFLLYIVMLQSCVYRVFVLSSKNAQYSLNWPKRISSFTYFIVYSHVL